MKERAILQGLTFALLYNASRLVRHYEIHRMRSVISLFLGVRLVGPKREENAERNKGDRGGARSTGLLPYILVRRFSRCAPTN